LTIAAAFEAKQGQLLSALLRGGWTLSDVCKLTAHPPTSNKNKKGKEARGSHRRTTAAHRIAILLLL
jgi:hypothetical protein